MATNMEELKKLYVVERAFNIPRNAQEGEMTATISVKALTLDEISEFEPDENSSKEEQVKQLKRLIAKSLGTEPEIVNNFSIGSIQEIMECISETNKFSKTQQDKLDKIKTLIAQKQMQRGKQN